MSFDDWMLALHVISAFAFVAGIVLFWILIVAVRRADTPQETTRLSPLAIVGQAAVGIGAVGTIVLGIWLAFSVGSYDIWDPWIIAAIVLWLAAAGLGRRTGEEFLKGQNKALELEKAGQTESNAELLALNRTSSGVVLHLLVTIAVLLILIDMIWKPGA